LSSWGRPTTRLSGCHWTRTAGSWFCYCRASQPRRTAELVVLAAFCGKLITRNPVRVCLYSQVAAPGQYGAVSAKIAPPTSAASPPARALHNIFIVRCGSKNHELFVAKGDDGVYARGATRRKVACNHSDRHQKQSYSNESLGVGRMNAEQLTRQQWCGK
jgi:hypothetical protein